MSDPASRPHPTATATIATADAPITGDRWGDEIPEERARELEERLAAWDAEADHGDRKGPFDRDGWYGRLTGADVFYLAARALIGTTTDQGSIADLATAREALRAAPKNILLRFSLDLSALHLESAYLYQAQLEDATLNKAHLERAELSLAHLEDSYLIEARLERADLSLAHLERAYLDGLRLEDADLQFAHLEDATLDEAHLEFADLHGANLNRITRLNDATLTGVSLDQILLDNTNLAVVKWGGVAPLGDELRARAAKDDEGRHKSRETRLYDFEAAVRANRVLAVALRAQGMSDDADLFAYRAQVLQRQLSFRQRQFGRWLFSALLAALSGYGYRLGNIFRAYALVVLVFAAGYLIPAVANTGQLPTGQNALNALQISINAIHGRVFFAQFTLDTLQSWLATAESVCGIVIEGVFVAMLIQRLFR